MADDPFEALDVLTGDLRDFVNAMHGWHADQQKTLHKIHESAQDLVHAFSKLMHQEAEIYMMIGHLTGAVWTLEQAVEALRDESDEDAHG